jgi:DNA-binding winged helix-turn-helix (wHTH) protein
LGLGVISTASFWVYDPVEDRLFRDGRDGREEVPLSPQQHRLVAHMAERNRAGGGKSVLCEREELIAAVWGDEPGHGPQDLAYLVHQLRGRLAADPTRPALIVNERGRGYRLLAVEPRASGGDEPGHRSRRWLVIGGLAVVAASAAAAAVAYANLNQPAGPILREGSRGEDVLGLQRDLTAVGYDPVYLDGQYGPLTARAVRAFQQDHGLVVDGEVGRDTRAALRRALDSRRRTPTTP